MVKGKKGWSLKIEKKTTNSREKKESRYKPSNITTQRKRGHNPSKDLGKRSHGTT